MGGPIRISVLADTKDLGKGMASAEKSMQAAAAVAEKSAGKIESSFSSAAEGADTVASKGSQAAGALSGLGGLAALSGGKVGALGSAMAVAGVATQGLADAGDLLNVVTESTIVKNTLSRVSTIANAAAQTAASAASKTMTAAQWALNAALDANPIGILVIALAALAAGVVVAYKKSDKFRAVVQAAFGAVVSSAKALASFVTVTIPAAFEKVTAGARTKVSDLVSLVKGIPGKVTHAVGDLSSLLLDEGGHIIGGLIQGIKSKAGDLVSTIEHFVIDKIPGPVRKALGIHSPSKVMMEVGEWTVIGLAKGIESASKTKLKASVDTATQVLQSVKTQAQGVHDSVASTFGGDLFQASTASSFLSDLTTTSSNNTRLSVAFKTLEGDGWKPDALSQLYQSGNTALILDLAANKSTATKAASQYQTVQSGLSALGDQVADAQYGKAIKLDKDTINELAAALEKPGARRHKDLLAALRQAQADAGAGAMSAVNRAASVGHKAKPKASMKVRK